MIIANLLGISSLLYVFWKRLKDDYHYEKIFNLVFLIVFSFIISGAVLSFIPNIFSFWIVLVAMFLGFYIGIRRQRMSFFESFDSFVIGCLPWLGILYLFDTTKNSSLSSFIGFWFILICMFVYFYINATYKTFNWYKSGRVGIAGIVTAILFFVLRAISSVFMPNMVHTAGNYEIYLSASGALLLSILLYNLKKLKT